MPNSPPDTPAADQYSLEAIVRGVADDLIALRKGAISIQDAQARAQLAKQYMNGARLIINARRSLEEAAKPTRSRLPSRDMAT